MANPKGSLAGFTDPYDPNWRENIMGRIKERQNRDYTNRHHRPTQINVRGDIPFFGMVKRAAEQRGISIAAYARRAIGAFVAADLGIEFEEVMRHTPKATPWGEKNPQVQGKTTDDGEGFGQWKVQ